jgi:hypothetical protein
MATPNPRCTARPPCILSDVPLEQVVLKWGGPAIGRKAVALPIAKTIWIDPTFWGSLNYVQGRQVIFCHEWAHLEGARCESCADFRGGEHLREMGHGTSRDAQRTMRAALENRDAVRASEDVAAGFGELDRQRALRRPRPVLASRGTRVVYNSGGPQSLEGADDYGGWELPANYVAAPSDVPELEPGPLSPLAVPLPGGNVVKEVEGYRQGKAFALQVTEIAPGHWVNVDAAPSWRAAVAEAKAAGIAVGISSAFRDNADQERLYAGFKAGTPGFNPADPPGWSKHQAGNAVDGAFKTTAERERFATIAARHGWTRPISREPWHFVHATSSGPGLVASAATAAGPGTALAVLAALTVLH